MTIFFPQYASFTINLSISYWKLFSAFATAEEIVFLISLDILFSEKVRFLNATSTFFPTIAFNIGFSFLIHNGRKFIPLTISEDMVGHKLGEFAPTRTFHGHTLADKKALKDSAVVKKVTK